MSVCLQLDIEVAFRYPDLAVVGSGEEELERQEFDCANGGSAQRGAFGPFGLLVLADEDLAEHTGVFFYIAYQGNGKWVTLVCSDQSRYNLEADYTWPVFETDARNPLLPC